MASEFGKVVFKVSEDADKQGIKAAVEALFNVEVTKVNTININGKQKRFRGRLGKRNDVRKAVVTLKEGQTIDFAAGVK
jgi:large subunit ribosomal protein L23